MFSVSGIPKIIKIGSFSRSYSKDNIDALYINLHSSIHGDGKQTRKNMQNVVHVCRIVVEMRRL